MLLPEARDQLAGVTGLKNILFVDDEIGSGVTAKASLDVVLKATTPSQRPGRLTYVIAAENSDFNWSCETPGVDVRFVPWARKTEGVFSVISHIIPPAIEAHLEGLPRDPDSSPTKYRMNLLLGLPVKQLTEAGPRFTYGYNQIAQREVEELPALKREFRAYLQDLIAETIASLPYPGGRTGAVSC